VSVLNLMIVLVTPPVIAGVFSRRSNEGLPGFCLRWAGTAGVTMIIWAAVHLWFFALADLINVAVAIAAWWLSRRRRRRRVPREYGVKSRALVAALIRRAREAAVPRRVLRPVPEGT
jgi:hypothetical protein